MLDKIPDIAVSRQDLLFADEERSRYEEFRKASDQQVSDTKSAPSSERALKLLK